MNEIYKSCFMRVLGVYGFLMQRTNDYNVILLDRVKNQFSKIRYKSRKNSGYRYKILLYNIFC